MSVREVHGPARVYMCRFSQTRVGTGFDSLGARWVVRSVRVYNL